jgi:hypothetical protein
VGKKDAVILPSAAKGRISVFVFALLLLLRIPSLRLTIPLPIANRLFLVTGGSLLLALPSAALLLLLTLLASIAHPTNLQQ